MVQISDTIHACEDTSLMQNAFSYLVFKLDLEHDE